ncbi:MAG: flagellin [Opitutaceae bacterium]
MSVVINTNTAATIASNNLSASTAMLQKSLMRLSSGSKIVNAADDAGGVAVATRLAAASKRSAVAQSNISNSLAFLQQQDSTLKTGIKMMTRMNELQALYRDNTKSTTDKSLYAIEFNALKTEFVNSVKNATFNGISLNQASAALSVTTNDANSTYSLSDNSSYVASSSSYLITDGGNFATVTGTLTGGTTATGTLVLATGTAGNSTTTSITLTGTNSISAVVTAINNSAAAVTASVNADGKLVLTAKNEADNIYILPAGDAASGEALQGLGLSEHATTAQASPAGTTNNSLIALSNLAKARANNGSNQSILGYYSELATASETNYNSAVSRITDVDVAEESTQLARWNTLVQAGTAMIAQANGSTQSALSLLK